MSIDLTDVRKLTDDQYGQLALLVMYAWDMCDQALIPSSVATDPRIAADGWTVVGIFIGGDNIAVSGQNIRQQFMAAGTNFKRYGYLAVDLNNPNSYIAVIRGTDGAEEWEDDFDFLAKSGTPFTGNVESGFFDIYRSMQYFALAKPETTVTLADGIAGAIPVGAKVTVLGHSLGSSLGIYLAYDLSDSKRLGTARTGAILFASPKSGDHDFVDGFAGQVTNYIVINYENDIVPDVPPFDIFHLDIFRTLPFCRILADGNSVAKINTGDKACCHHLICYAALLSVADFNNAKMAAGWTPDDVTCSQCVTL